MKTDIVLYDENAELSVIGACLMEPDVLIRCMTGGFIEPEMFYREIHRNAFRAIRGLFLEGATRLDPISVAHRMERDGFKDESCFGILLNATQTYVYAADAIKHAEIVREKYTRRKMLALARVAEDLATNASSEVAESWAELERLVYESNSAEAERVKDMRDVLNATWEELKSLRDNPAPLGISTGFSDLDDALGGLRRRDLVIIGARPSVGKTSLGMQIGTKAARSGSTVLVFSLEMSKEAIAQRMLAAEAEVDTRWLMTARMTTGQWEAGEQAKARLNSNLRMFIDASPSLDTAQMLAIARRIKAQEGGLDLILIDFLQLIKDAQATAHRGISKADIVGAAANRCKMMAGELNVPVILLSQLNRKPEDRENAKPQLSDLRDSGEIEQTADVVLMLYRPDEKRPELVRCLVEKNRNGPRGKVDMYFHSAYTKFSPITDKKGEDYGDFEIDVTERRSH